jgi:predicted DCC family thiol-disulfide oxidoreductase YuxK
MTDHPIVLFDGVCNLCTGSVQFIIARDPHALFRFAILQSPQGQELARAYHIDTTNVDSVILIDGKRSYAKSDAALEIARQLDSVWRFTYLFKIVPRALRDWVYDILARHRYQWFGQLDYCLTPTPELQARFLNQ